MASQLPNELLLAIASHAAHLKDVNALARTCWHCYRPLGWYIYERDAKSETSAALLWAATHGAEATAKKALTAGADPCFRSPDAYEGETPLHCSARRGHESILRLFFAVEGVDPNLQCHSLTPLAHAAANGHLHVVKYLAGLDEVDLNLTDAYNRSPLWHAVNGGNTELVRFLLSFKSVHRNVAPLSRDELSDSTSAFVLAVRYGHADMVELFLADGAVDPDELGLQNVSPLWIAASKGYPQIVKLLVGTGSVDVDRAESSYLRTPLIVASLHGHADIIAVLLSTEGVDANAMTRQSETSLYVAVEYKRIDSIRALLDSGKVNVNAICGRQYETALTKAVQLGHLEIIEALLSTPGIVVNGLGDGKCRGPLMAAMDADYSGSLRPHRITIIQRLLELEQIDANQSDRNGVTPLLCGIKREHGAAEATAAAVEALLSSNKVDPNLKDHRGDTPLIHAALKGDAAMTELLLKTGKVDANICSENGTSALSIAAERGNCSVIRALLAWPQTDPDIRNGDGLTPFALAAYYEWKLAANLLLRSGKVDVNSKDKLGRTPLSLAASLGHCDMVDWLLGEGADADAKSERKSQRSSVLSMSRYKNWALGKTSKASDKLAAMGKSINAGNSTR